MDADAESSAHRKIIFAPKNEEGMNGLPLK